MCLSTACSGGRNGYGYGLPRGRNQHYDTAHDGQSPSELRSASKEPVSTCPPQTKRPLHDNRAGPVEYVAGSQMQQRGRAKSKEPLSATPPRSTTRSPPASRPSSSSGSARTPQSASDPHNTGPLCALTPLFDEKDNPIQRLVNVRTAARLHKERAQIGPTQLKRKRDNSARRA